MTTARAVRLVSLGGRLLAAACLALALLLPQGIPGGVNLAVLADDSASMPAGFIDQAWQEISDLATALPQPGTLQLWRFAGGVRAESPAPAANTILFPRGAELDTSGTDIETALNAALNGLPADRRSVVLLISDAAATRGDVTSALRALSNASVPVYLWRPDGAPVNRAPQLLDLQLPARAAPGDRIPARAVVQGLPGLEFTLRVRENGIEQARFKGLLPPSGEIDFSFRLPLNQTGPVAFSVRVAAAGDGASGADAELTRVVNVRESPPLIYLSARPGPLVSFLERAGISVARITPDLLHGWRSELARAGAVIVDDMAANELDAVAWEALTRAVRLNGSGLLVLGGPHSYGAGAYRHSALEALLPVTAEARQPQEQAAVLFLLDKSGSMDQRGNDPGRLARGRRAVAAAASQLLPGDLLGITAFADDVELRLPLSPASTAIERALELQAGGGTRLAPALQSVLQQFAAVDVAQRLLVLVTDGFAVEENLQAQAHELALAGVTVIALAVGEDLRLATLEQLTAFHDGQILRVKDIATLPRLMSEAVAQQRAPAAAAAGPVLAVSSPPFLASVDTWPPLGGHMVTTLRPGADLYLQSAAGDPLLASAFAGIGRVAVLPGGLRDWAADWWSWPRMDEFLTGLIRWLARGSGELDLWLQVEEQGGELLFTIDEQAAGRWSSEPPRLVFRDPAERVIDVPLQLVAPGRFSGGHTVSLTGLYELTVQGQRETLHQGYFYNGARERAYSEAVRAEQEQWLRQGLVRPWQGTAALLAELPADPWISRSFLLALAGLLYLLLLLWERRLLRPRRSGP